MKTLPCLMAALAAATILFNCNQSTPAPATAEAPKPAIDPVKRGEYLVGIMGCNDCHSPKTMTAQGPIPDPARLLSGHPAELPAGKVPAKELVQSGQWVMFNPMLTLGAGPWGISFAANLTPDDTGIGSWSYEQFKKAITEGKSKGLDGTRPLLPPMPWQNYRNMNDEDMRAVFAYLKSLPPVKNVVPAPVPPTGL